jgi:hypothetical protein
MSGNLSGFRSSGRFAALLTFPNVGTCLNAFHPQLQGGPAGIVAAGLNPAAKETLVS